MNIFFLHSDPAKAAINLNYPKLQNKMIVEYLQVICATFNLHDIESPYKTTHEKHPSRLWLENDKNNIIWLYQCTQTLLDIYYERSKKKHKCQDVLDWCINNTYKLDVKCDYNTTLPYLAMGATPEIRYEHSTSVKHNEQDVWLAKSWNDAVLAYRKYMQTKDYWKSEYSFVD